MANQIKIVMKAQLNTPPYQFVTWQVFGQPDNTGAQSGYPIGTLINIAADYLIDPTQTINPISLTVGGDLSGSLPNPSVSGLQGKPISSTDPIANQILQYNGTNWIPKTNYLARGTILTNVTPTIVAGSSYGISTVTLIPSGPSQITPRFKVRFATPALNTNYLVTGFVDDFDINTSTNLLILGTANKTINDIEFFIVDVINSSTTANYGYTFTFGITEF